MREKRTLQNAHMPTWIKATIMGLRAGATRGSYRDLGRKIGANIESYHDEGIDPIDERFSDDEWNSIFTWDGFERHYLRDGVKPTAILQRIFASDRHPDGYGDLVRQIPLHQRSNFLSGIVDGYRLDR